MTTSIRLALVAIAATTVSCTDGPADPAGEPAATTDSAGVPVVASDTSQVSVRLRFSAEPEWSITQVPLRDGVSPLYDVRDIARFPGGEIAVSHGSTASVLVGDPRSRAPWIELGRRGEGPAEFGDVRSLQLRGDTVRALDPRRGRVLAFLARGDFLGAHRLPDGPRDKLLLWSPFGGTEAVVHLSFVPDALADSTVRGSGPVLVRRGEQWDSVTAVPGVESFSIPGLGGEAPAGARTYIAGTPHGLWIGDNARAEIRRISGAGSVELVARWPPDLSRDPEAQSERAIEAQIQEFRKMSEPDPGDLALLRSIPPSRRAPQFTGLLAAEDGSIWVGPYEAGLGWMWNPIRDGGDWIVISRTGVVSARVTVPPRFEPLAVSDDRVIGVRFDELDTEWLEAYRLVPAGSDAASAPADRVGERPR